MKKFFVLLIKFYKKAISPFLPRSCRYYPTCSDYAEESIVRFGAIQGGLMAFKRIMRCHPWAKGGYDPVCPIKYKNECKDNYL